MNLNGMSYWRLRLAYASATLILVSVFLLEGVNIWVSSTIHTHNLHLDRLIPIVQAGQIMAASGFILALFAKGHTRLFFIIAALLESWFWLDYTSFA